MHVRGFFCIIRGVSPAGEARIHERNDPEMSASREKNKRKEQIASGETPAVPEKKGMSKGLKWTIGII